MVPPYMPKHIAASPKRRFFDPWNTASTGHQRAETRMSGSTSWRQSRNAKLQSQFAAGFAGDGGKRMYDSVGAGSQDFGADGRTDTGWEDSVMGWRGRQGIGNDQADIGAWVRSGGKLGFGRSIPNEKRKADNISGQVEREAIAKKPKVENRSTRPKPRLSKETHSDEEENFPPPSAQPRAATASPSPSIVSAESIPGSKPSKKGPTADKENEIKAKLPQIFANLTIFINGTTMPLISDHKLKHLLTTHGARMSIGLGRRSVTHVILGKPNSGVGKGAGGGLASSKIEKEILRRGGSGNGIRYVSVEWILESITAGMRLPESRFPGVNTAPAGVKSVRNMFAK